MGMYSTCTCKGVRNNVLFAVYTNCVPDFVAHIARQGLTRLGTRQCGGGHYFGCGITNMIGCGITNMNIINNTVYGLSL